MICPECKGRTEVIEVTQRGQLTRRRRRCLDRGHRFSTLESLVGHEKQQIDLGSPAARPRRPGFDAEAIAAAIAVDRRKAKIAREQRERSRFEDEHSAPRHLRGHVLRRELKGY